MLIFNLTHSLTNLSFKLILIPITHNGFVYLKKIGNYQKTFYVITKMMLKTKTETTLLL